jgi:ubiquinol-cytochrome c reductase cytochrome c1 subunit
MKRQLPLLLALLFSSGASATGGENLIRAEVSLNPASLQRGARTFVNYCVSCHSAGYARYSRVATDLGIPEDVMARNMMFTTDKVGDTMRVAMRKEDGEVWFGVSPPDLSVVARARGADWLTTFLSTFYLDPKRPTGVNNLAFKETAMPHVLWELQGLKRLPAEGGPAEQAGGHGAAHGPALETVSAGLQNENEYAETVRDLVNFLVYLGEPAKLHRYTIGIWVTLFLIGFWFVAYLLKKEFWRDVH